MVLIVPQAMACGEVAVRELTSNCLTEVEYLIISAFTFPSFEKTPVPIRVG